MFLVRLNDDDYISNTYWRFPTDKVFRKQFTPARQITRKWQHCDNIIYIYIRIKSNAAIYIDSRNLYFNTNNDTFPLNIFIPIDKFRQTAFAFYIVIFTRFFNIIIRILLYETIVENRLKSEIEPHVILGRRVMTFFFIQIYDIRVHRRKYLFET